MEKNQSRFLRRNTEINTVMKRILSGLGCWLAIGISLYGVENLPLLMQRGKYGQVKSLVEAGDADLEATDSFNRTVLHWAALDNAELIPLLLKKGSDIEAMDGSGMTPLHHAVSARNTAAVEKLLAGKADIRATDKSQNQVLHFACRGKAPKPEIITLLLKMEPMSMQRTTAAQRLSCLSIVPAATIQKSSVPYSMQSRMSMRRISRERRH